MESEADRVSSAIVLEIVLSKMFENKLFSFSDLSVEKKIWPAGLFFTHTPPPPLWGKMWRSSEQVRREYSQVSAHSFLHYDFRMWKVEFQACSKLSVKYLELRNGSLLFDTVTLIP